jgi:hypothetical protein
VSDYQTWTIRQLIELLAYWRERYRTDGPLHEIVERCEQILTEIRRRDPDFER